MVLVALLVARALSYAFIRYMRGRRYLGKRTLIIGAESVSQGLALALKRERACGLNPVGFVDSDVPRRCAGTCRCCCSVSALTCIGSCSPIDRIPALRIQLRARLAAGRCHPRRPATAGNDLRGARLFEVMPSQAPNDHVSDIPLGPALE